MLPLVSAILADSYWDRYSTIAVSSLLYVLVSPPCSAN
jgi:peptide/histidine transporter 3/4